MCAYDWYSYSQHIKLNLSSNIRMKKLHPFKNCYTVIFLYDASGTCDFKKGGTYRKERVFPLLFSSFISLTCESRQRGEKNHATPNEGNTLEE